MRHPRLCSIGALALLLALTACSGRTEWARACSTEEDLAAETRICLEASGNTTGVMNLRTSRFLNACLEERGWEQRPLGDVPYCDDPNFAAEEEEAVEEEASSPARMDFETCFERCRRLTDRSKDACFDTCLQAPGVR